MVVVYGERRRREREDEDSDLMFAEFGVST